MDGSTGNSQTSLNNSNHKNRSRHAPAVPPHMVGVRPDASEASSSNVPPELSRRVNTSTTIPGTRPLNDHSRSVSLPQALHSFTLSGRRPRLSTTKRIRVSNTNTNNDQEHQGYQEHHGHIEEHPQEHHRSGFTSRLARIVPFKSGPESLEPEPTSPVDAPNTGASTSTSPLRQDATKRAISEGGSLISGPRILERSHTTPRLASVFCAGDTELLDPLPQQANQSRKNHKRSLRTGIQLVGPVTKTNESLNEYTSPTVDGDVNSIAYNTAPNWGATQRALNCPDILRSIFESLDSMMVIPHELVQQRRKPLSLRHAQLMFGDTKKAIEALEYTQPTTTTESPAPGLYNCLLVNSTWYDSAVRILERQIHFRSNERWIQFARRGAPALTRKPRKLVLHKLNEAMQVEIDLLERQQLGEQLEWLEFYTCAVIAPSPSLLGPQLTRIILPGCFRVNDLTMSYIAEKCPQLRHLDIRACELVTDRGIKLIAKYCPQLELLNVGRTHGGEHITYKGIKHLARQTKLSTLGIAGCHVDDRAVWELALNRGPKLERLSLNNCSFLTDLGIPKVLGYMPNLTVLEIRGCVHITNMRPIALFKSYLERQGKPPLIEGCEVIERRLQDAVNQLHRERNNRIFNDLESWANQHESDDNPMS